MLSADEARIALPREPWQLILAGCPRNGHQELLTLNWSILTKETLGCVYDRIIFIMFSVS